MYQFESHPISQIMHGQIDHNLVVAGNRRNKLMNQRKLAIIWMHKMIMQTDRNEVRKLNTFKLEIDHKSNVCEGCEMLKTSNNNF